MGECVKVVILITGEVFIAFGPSNTGSIVLCCTISHSSDELH